MDRQRHGRRRAGSGRLFVDNTHRVFTSSDTTAALLDVLPRLKSGVLVESHDKLPPDDCPPSRTDRF
ncbi:MAG: hypothetical protein IPM29_05975 [Planctomycetes bacterium]|nr:hypothetical protein [Planctomycetota bacterium]